MTVKQSRWSLSAKLALVGAPFLLLALISTGATLWISWQLDGGAAAVNEAGRMRMQAHRMALTVGSAARGAGTASAHPEIRRESCAAAQRRPRRPPQVPWDKTAPALHRVEHD
jgi:two-component system nitrate/nitrite sensor histidine kinase NarX